MLLASWNVNSLKVRLPHLLQWLDAVRPDVVGLQETKLVDEAFPRAELEAAGYHCTFAGQKTYHGVAVLSREPAVEMVADLPGFVDESRRVLGVTIGELRFLNLYVPNGQAVGSDKYLYKLNWLEALHKYCRDQLERYPLLAMVGDFNIAPDERDVHDPELWRGKIHFSEPEREALAKLKAWGLVDVFRLHYDDGGLYSWWDYRAGNFHKHLGMRIDLMLASKPLAERSQWALIDRNARKGQQPSDHAPLIAEFDVEGLA